MLARCVLVYEIIWKQAKLLVETLREIGRRAEAYEEVHFAYFHVAAFHEISNAKMKITTKKKTNSILKISFWILTFLQLKLTEQIILSVVCLCSLANDCGGVQQY